MDNYILGIVVVISFWVYQLASLLYLFSTAEEKLQNLNAQIKETEEELGVVQKKQSSKRKWIELIIAQTIVYVGATVFTYFAAVESRRWIVLVSYTIAYVIVLLVYRYAMKHPKKKEEDGKKEND